MPCAAAKPDSVQKAENALIRVHIQVACIGPHVACNKARRVKCIGISVFDRRDIRSLDAQFALHVEQGFAHGGAFATHNVPEVKLKGVEPFGSTSFVFYDA